MVATHFGEANVLWGWIFMALGITSGSILGLWSFNGPFPTPKGWEDYAALPRRMTRLAHIAFFMLPLLSIVYGSYIDTVPLTVGLREIGSYCMLVCMFGVPTLLIASSCYLPFKYLEVIPVSAGMVAFYIMAYGNYLKL